MQAGWRIGSIFGIPLFINSSWFLIVVWVTIVTRQDYIEQWGPSLSWSAGFVIALLLFCSVLLHELGHSLVAQAQGIKVNSITLFLFGGVASIDRESKTPAEAFQVAIAGPLVSLGLFFVLSVLTQFLPDPSLSGIIAQRLAGINLVLAMFNLIPGLPLDGGQVLKAAIWKITGNRFTGTRWAARTGQGLGIAAVILGITNLPGGLWIALIGWFAWQNASSYTRLSDLQEVLIKVTAADTMTREFRVVDANLTIREFADQYLIATDSIPVYFAASEGRYRGFVAVDAIGDIERSLWEEKTIHDIVQPLEQLVTVSEKASLLTVINALETEETNQITVLSPAEAVAGIIDRGDIVRVVGKSLNVIIPEAEIKRIKSGCRYPPGLPLGEIAKKTDLSDD